MSARTYCLPVALLVVTLHLASGTFGVDDDSNELSPRLYTRRSIDEVSLNVFEGRVGGHDDDIIDGPDMILSPKQYERLYSSSVVRGRREHRIIATPWTDGIIPYEIRDRDFNDDQKDWIRRAMDNWESETCVRFIPATSRNKRKVIVQTGHGCSAHLGMKTEESSQDCKLDPKCFWKGMIEHELGHALGLIHEHQRPNRDAYIRVDYYCVKSDQVGSLQKYARGSDDKMGLSYDYSSIMHYAKNAFAKERCTQTIFPIDTTKTDVIGMALKPSFLDFKLVNLMYRCADRCKKHPQCPDDCFVNADCKCVCKEDISEECKDNNTKCSEWAHAGECSKNTIYMHTNCRKSCGICKEDGSTPMLICANSNKKCEEWARKGECDKNPGYMRVQCKPACGDCKTIEDYSVEGPCKDKNSTCRRLAEAGECNRHVESMLRDCKKSCNFCPKDIGKDPSDKPGCVDFDTVCQYKAECGHCQKFYAAMVTECPQHCGFCGKNITLPADCVDDDTACPGWAGRAECDRNPNYMKKNCKKSCNVCPGLDVPNECIDYDLSCPGWYEKGECEFNPKWMEKNCMKSCYICTKEKPPVVCKDYNSKCAGWAAKGECEKNPKWMIPHCRKSCKSCQSGSDGGDTTTKPPSGDGDTTTKPPSGDGDTINKPPSEDCKDDSKKCQRYADRGECKKNPSWMGKHCRKSCNLCSKEDCKDDSTKCPHYADRGECEKNPSWMHKHCKKSCKRC